MAAASSRRSRRRVRWWLAGILIAPLVLGFLGDLFWAFDLLSNFRPHGGVLLLATALAVWRFDRQVASLLGLAGLVAVSALAPAYLGSSPAPVGDTIEIVSFNVGISNPHRDDVGDFLAAERPDLVFLFESSFEWEDAMRRSGVPLTIVSVVPRGRLAGVTVLASPDIDPVAIDANVGGEAAGVTVRIGGVDVDVLGIHPPSPTTGDRAARRDGMLEAAGRWVAGRSNPVVVVGDFNATPWSAAFRTLRWQGGLIDTLPGSGLQASWPDGWGPLSIPIDHVLHTPGLGAEERRTGPSFGSAHRPVLVSIGLSG